MLSFLNTNYNKFVIIALTLIVVVGNQMVGQDLGLSPMAMKWVSLVVGSAGAVLTLLTANKNAVNLQPGQVVVPAANVTPNVPVIAAHKP